MENSFIGGLTPAWIIGAPMLTAPVEAMRTPETNSASPQSSARGAYTAAPQ